MDKKSKRFTLKVEEITKLVSDETYAVILSMLASGYSISLNKVRVLRYIIDNSDSSITKISKDLGIDYKNTWRMVNELIKEKKVMAGETSQGVPSELKMIKIRHS